MRRRRAAPMVSYSSAPLYAASPSGQYVLRREGRELMRGTEDQVLRRLHNLFPGSYQTALRHEGYSIDPVEAKGHRANVGSENRRAYDWFRGRGYPGHEALDLARAEKEAFERGWYFQWEHEQEPLEDFLGDVPAEDVSENMYLAMFDEDGQLLDGLGGILFGHGQYARDHASERVWEAEMARDYLLEAGSLQKVQRRNSHRRRHHRNAAPAQVASEALSIALWEIVMNGFGPDEEIGSASEPPYEWVGIMRNGRELAESLPEFEKLADVTVPKLERDELRDAAGVILFVDSDGRRGADLWFDDARMERSWNRMVNDPIFAGQ